jgi:hypothetical protein
MPAFLAPEAGVGDEGVDLALASADSIDGGADGTGKMVQPISRPMKLSRSQSAAPLAPRFRSSGVLSSSSYSNRLFRPSRPERRTGSRAGRPRNSGMAGLRMASVRARAVALSGDMTVSPWKMPL